MSLQKAQVRLYTRPGCHLCELAKGQMRAANCADLYVLEEVNIDGDSELVKRYGKVIPVIAINGIEEFKYRVTKSAFRKAVMNATQSAR